MKSSESLQNLIRLIKIESVKSESAKNAPFGLAVRAALDEFFSIARENGFDPIDVDGYAGFVELKSKTNSTETVGILCHLDVVPTGDGWHFAQGEIADGKIYGRGVADDKGPTVACLYALKNLRDSGFAPNKNIRLIVGCDEESGSDCMAYYKQKIGMPTIGFSPDSDFPFVYFEKTILHLTAALPAPDALIGFFAGQRPNVVPDRCVCITKTAIDESVATENGFQRIDTGKAAHAMNPELGENAVFKAARALKSVAEKNSPFARLINLCSSDAVETLGITVRNDPTGEQTVNLGMVRLHEKTVYATFDFRCPKSQRAEEIPDILSDYLNAPVQIDASSPYLYSDVNGELCQKLNRAWLSVTGKPLPPVVSGGGTYARSMNNCVGFGPYLPGEDNKIHDADEFLRIEHFETLIDVYAAAVRELSV